MNHLHQKRTSFAGYIKNQQEGWLDMFNAISETDTENKKHVCQSSISVQSNPALPSPPELR